MIKHPTDIEFPRKCCVGTSSEHDTCILIRIERNKNCCRRLTVDDGYGQEVILDLNDAEWTQLLQWFGVH